MHALRAACAFSLPGSEHVQDTVRHVRTYVPVLALLNLPLTCTQIKLAGADSMATVEGPPPRELERANPDDKLSFALSMHSSRAQPERKLVRCC
jgi:hypothetical protein